MKRYWNLLRTQPLLAKLSLIQLIAYFGAWFSNVAIYTLLITLNVDASIIAFVAALHFFAGVLQAPLSGALIDKISPKKLMIVLTVIEISCTLMLMSIDEVSKLPLLYVLVFARMAAASFQFTVEMSLLPRILSGKALQSANEIHSIIWSLSYTLGMALSGLLVYSVGVKYAFLLDALLFVIVLLLQMNLHFTLEQIKSTSRFMTMMGDALRYIRKERIVWHLMLLHSVVSFTTFDALVVLSAQKYYMNIIAISLGIGLVHAARAVGLAIGPLFLGEWVNIRRLEFLLLAEALAIGVWAWAMSDFYASLAASVLVGFMTTTLWSYTYTLIQKHTHPEYYGRVVAYNDMIFLGVGGLVSLMIGFLVNMGWTLESITVLLGSAFLIAAVYYRWLRQHYELQEIE
ncbi:MAG: MFS transporter [Sulfuricurvum sp. 17-40-25]|nr:MAG: MFS transporter [Campylobacterales bacterium 16-40-21]OZA04418.1 MAG: MFS transporter [Sulfuricurvum sp. 17-40-25]